MKHAALVRDFSVKKTDEPEFLEQMVPLAAMVELIASVYPAGAHGDPPFVPMASTCCISSNKSDHPMPYTLTPTKLPEVLILEPKVFGDSRGFFFESFNQRDFAQVTGLDLQFVQDNHSRSVKGVLRGLHYQIQHPQGKLVCVTQGEVFDVVVDMRRSSPNFGKWDGVLLSADNKRQLWVPPGFAHGFMVTSDTAEFLYKTTDYWYPEFERSLLSNDPTVGVQWPLTAAPRLAAKDAAAKTLAEVEVFA